MTKFREKDLDAVKNGVGYHVGSAVLCHNGDGMRFITYLEFPAGKVKGNHYHKEKYENMVVIKGEVEAKYYLSEKIKPTLLSDGSAGFRSNSEIDQVVARPLTATMHKMHRACQDNYYSDLFIQSNGEDRPSERMTKEELSRIPIRKLTPKEAFMLQGFPQNFADNAGHARVANGAMYKQAGNAVSVNTIYAVLYYLITNRIIRQ